MLYAAVEPRGLALASSLLRGPSTVSVKAARAAAAACTAGGPGGGQNFPPVAIPDYVVALAFSSFWAGPLDVLLNDTDPNLPSDTLTVTSVTGSSYASIAAGGGDVIFAGPPGIYNLNYTIKDSQNATSSATVTLELVYCEFGC
jgi:hypothetical protein